MKKVLLVLMALAIVSSLFCVTAYAVGNPYDRLVLLPENSEKYVNSSITSTSKQMTGVVYSSSTRDVYFRMRYRTNSVTYKTDTALLISHKTSDSWFYDKSSVNKLSSKAYWRFELDNYGVGTKGGFAQGWMW